MLNSIIYDDEITVFWDLQLQFQKPYKYIVCLNGVFAGETEKTHFEFYGLKPQTNYNVKIILQKDKDEIILFENDFITKATPLKLDITKKPYFAKGDGITLNTLAIQKALNDCKKGQCVYVPKGKFLTGALFVHSDTEIYVDKGGMLLGTTEPSDYLPKIKSRFEGTENFSYASLINLGELDTHGDYNCKNVTIRGKGSIIGGGESLGKNEIEAERAFLKSNNMETDNAEVEHSDTIPGRRRSRLINISNSQNVVLSGLELGFSACWNVHMIYSDNVITSGCTIVSKGVHNGDGWDPDSSTNCTLFGCTFNTGDDCVAIKSGKNPEGNVINKPTQNIKIFDNKVVCGHAFAIGSEMSGGVENVYFWDNDLSNTYYGLQIKSTEKRGGFVKNIFLYDSVVPRIFVVSSVNYNNDGEAAPTKPIFENFTFENITITGYGVDFFNKKEPCDPITIYGQNELGHEVNNVTIKNCKILKKEDDNFQNIVIKHIKNLNITNLDIE